MPLICVLAYVINFVIHSVVITATVATSVGGSRDATVYILSNAVLMIVICYPNQRQYQLWSDYKCLSMHIIVCVLSYHTLASCMDVYVVDTLYVDLLTGILLKKVLFSLCEQLPCSALIIVRFNYEWLPHNAIYQPSVHT